jgi:ABC-type Na+ efflux pump permease subunit
MAELPEFAAILPRPAPPLPMHAGHMPAPSSGGTNQMALWAMITGIFFLLCCQILAPISIVLGAVALSQLKHHPERSGTGYAIAGIVLGVLALLMVVTALVLFISNPSMFQNFQNALPQ